MNIFLKTVWIPVLLFLIFELAFYFYGNYFMGLHCAACVDCLPDSLKCPPCSCISGGNRMMMVGLTPSFIISVITYLIFLVLKRKK